MENSKNMNSTENGSQVTEIIGTAVKLPGVRVDRRAFLLEQFKDAEPELREAILKDGTIEAGVSRTELKKLARKIVSNRTIASSGASFVAGIPGGFAMAATIPADTLQFYAFALRMAQEIAYLYGEKDLFENGGLESERATNQLLLYCGVMLGASGAAQAVRLVSASLAKQALKKLPQMALTKTFYYPIVKSVAKALGARMTKGIFAKGVSKAVPLIGGVVSGGITMATMRPMGMRLVDTLDEAHFAYTQAEYDADMKIVMAECAEVEQEEKTVSPALKEIQKAKEMLDAGIITDAEFAAIKEKIISQM